ncbi:MFS transporter [Streptomyces sp. 3MP-14]|uniref:MFS transporter n=1 Tax=Streptomyces mimosae TaxID=2586635 RepID=A0A5N6AA00_9ACTN|nr:MULTISPECIES: MFS transporter [Streptomyces]KAB8164659.1 MFS transporter [Streptomyces mimosae]KAB8175575.1 MFS transporter [Streptomyces sp. 3MP-14]
MSSLTATDRPVRARCAVAALFFTNGFLFANVVPRYPEIKSDLGLSNAALGTAIAAMPLGALVLGLAASPLIKRYGSARTAVVSQLLMGFNILLVGTAPNFAVLCLGLFLAGSLDAITDVAMNAHGLRVQRRYGRSILNSFHGLWSVGAVVGGIAGAGAAQLGLSLAVHLAIVGALTVGSALTSSRFLLPGPEDAERAPGNGADGTEGTNGAAGADGAAGRRSWLRRPVLMAFALLGLITAATAVIEDAPASWGSNYLQNELGSSPFIGGMAFMALQGTQTVARLLGDRVVHRLGDRATARIGGLLVLVGMGVALLWPSVPTTVLGFGLCGIGIATIIPAAFHAADEIPGLWPGAGITVAAFLLRVGFLVSPPVIGLIADAESIRLGLVLVPVAGLALLATSGILDTRRTDDPVHGGDTGSEAGTGTDSAAARAR